MKSLFRFSWRNGNLLGSTTNEEIVQSRQRSHVCAERGTAAFSLTHASCGATRVAVSALVRLAFFLITPVTASLVLSGLAGCAGNGSLQNTSLDRLIDSLEKRAYLVRQFRTEFIKTRRAAVFKRDLSVKGRLVFQRPNSFLLTMTGDVNLEVLSDGENISLTHDNKDHEVYRLQGERDLSKFSDPLMAVIQGIGDGGIRRFTPIQTVKNNGTTVLELEPNGQANFERIEKVAVVIADPAEIKRVTVFFKDGDQDETIFRSWILLAHDDPDILDLRDKLKRLSRVQNPRFAEMSPISEPQLSRLSPWIFEMLATDVSVDHQR